MMQHIAPLLVIFALLTGPNGRTIYVAKEQIVAIVAAVAGECEKEGHAIILTSAGRLCVAEHPETAAEAAK